MNLLALILSKEKAPIVNDILETYQIAAPHLENSSFNFSKKKIERI